MALATVRALAALLLLALLPTASAQTFDPQIFDPETGEPVPLARAAPPTVRAAARGGDDYLIPIQHLPAGSTKLVRSLPGGFVMYEDGADLLFGSVVILVSGGEPVFDELTRVTLPALPTDAVVADGRLYVTLGKAPGLIVYDLAGLDSSNPTVVELDRADFPSALAVAVSADRVYVGRGAAGVAVLGRADLAPLGGFDTPGSANGLALTVFDFGVPILVVADGNLSSGDDVRVYDVTDPAATLLVSSFEANGFATYAAMLTDQVVLVTGAAGLTAIDLALGSVLDVVGADGITYEVVVDESAGRAYINGLGGARVVDVSDPADLAVLAVNDFGGQGLSLAVEGASGFVLAADRFGGLRLLDPSSLDEQARFENGGFSHKPYVDPFSQRLFVTDLAGRLRTFQLGFGDATEEIVAARVDVPSNTQEVLTTQDGVAFVTHGVGVSVLDVTGPVPQPLAELDLGQQALGMAMRGDVLFVANGFGGLVAVDVADPAAPAVLSTTPIGSNLVDVAADPFGSGALVYLTSFGGGMLVYDVSDPAAPVQIGAEPDFGFLNAITFSEFSSDAVAFVADGQAGLRVVDVSDPAALASVATAPAATQARDVSAGRFTNDGSFDLSVAVADDFFGVRLFAYDEGAIEPRGASATADRGIGVATWMPQIVTGRAGSAVPDVVIVAAGEAGVYLYQAEVFVASEPAADGGTLRLEAWPNPTRGDAVVAVELASAADVSASVYDALGRRVAEVAVGPRGAGRHEIALDTRGWAPGVYVARVQAGDAAATARLTVVR